MRPFLFYIACRRYPDGRTLTGRSVEVDSIYEAIRQADYDTSVNCFPGFGMQYAGRFWWLVAAWTEWDARLQAKRLAAGRHPRQFDMRWFHAQVRAGLEPDTAPLNADDPPCQLLRRPRLGRPDVLPLWSKTYAQPANTR